MIFSKLPEKNVVGAIILLINNCGMIFLFSMISEQKNTQIIHNDKEGAKMEIGKIFGKSWEEYKESWKEWTLTCLIYFGILMGGMILMLPLLITMMVIFIDIVEYGGGNMLTIMILILLYITIVLIISLISFSMSIGVIKCAMEKTRKREIQYKDIFFIFKNRPFKFIGFYCVYNIFIILWSLLLIVPGIIKSYSYSQALYLMVENPDYGILECITKSREIMEGNKTSLFLISLIFLGVGLVFNFIPLGGLVASFMIMPLSYLAHLNFYNEVTGYKHNDDVIIEKY